MNFKIFKVLIVVVCDKIITYIHSIRMNFIPHSSHRIKKQKDGMNFHSIGMIYPPK